MRDRLRHALLVFQIFLPMPIIGTLVHELGHASVAWSMGDAATIHYGSTWPEGSFDRAGQFLFTLGGPLITVLIGSVGLILLVRMRRGDRRRMSPTPAEWIALIAALFWSRELFILLTSLPNYISGAALRSDETKLAMMLDLPRWSVAAFLGLLGLIVCLWVARLYPADRRLDFVMAGSAACVVGFVFWYEVAGPVLMP